MPTTPFVCKAQEALDASVFLLERGWTNSAANRAYYAVFHAARSALVAARVCSLEHAWSHKALQSTFSQLVRRQKAIPAHLPAILTHNRDVRAVADYEVEMVSLRIARTAVLRAEEFVGHIRKVIEQ
jgi:uncharacterized protein (UPF0332 family)